MYISLDKDALVFLHKHAQRRVVTQLATIEAPHLHIQVLGCEQLRDFEEFTDYELRKLYENTTGIKYPGFFRPGLLSVCFEAARQVTDTDALAWEVDLQERCVSPTDRKRYAYKKGATAPTPVIELFDLPPKRCTVDASVIASALALRQPIIHAPYVAPLAAQGPDRANALPKVPRAPSAPTAPRGAGRERIWACADRLWEEAGKPTAIPKVLELRKRMMDELEKDGLKRTSVSCELGNWQKSRVLVAII